MTISLPDWLPKQCCGLTHHRFDVLLDHLGWLQCIEWIEGCTHLCLSWYTLIGIAETQLCWLCAHLEWITNWILETRILGWVPATLWSWGRPTLKHENSICFSEVIYTLTAAPYLRTINSQIAISIQPDLAKETKIAELKNILKDQKPHIIAQLQKYESQGLLDWGVADSKIKGLMGRFQQRT